MPLMFFSPAVRAITDLYCTAKLREQLFTPCKPNYPCKGCKLLDFRRAQIAPEPKLVETKYTGFRIHGPRFCPAKIDHTAEITI